MIPIPQEILQVFRYSMAPHHRLAQTVLRMSTFADQELLSLPLIDLEKLYKPVPSIPKTLHFLHPEHKWPHFDNPETTDQY